MGRHEMPCQKKAGAMTTAKQVAPLDDNMTPCQRLEVKRFTELMWTLLRHAGRVHPRPIDVSGQALRVAKILKRRGFVTVQANDMLLTDAGHEALAIKHRGQPY
jgi:hypothetical protein